MPTTQRDQWEQKLDSQLAKLQQCQKEQKLKSCLPCPKIIDCPIRESYVKSVYDSMSKGKGGGFEF